MTNLLKISKTWKESSIDSDGTQTRNFNKIEQEIITIIKIFADYTQEINHPLKKALKYMVDNDKRPKYSQNWSVFYWHLPFIIWKPFGTLEKLKEAL